MARAAVTMAAGETDGFVKLTFDAKCGKLLGLAQKLTVTEQEILEPKHPHSTLSEAIVKGAGLADRKAIHI